MILATLIKYSQFVKFNEFFIVLLMEKSIRWTIKNKNRQYLYLIPQQGK